MIKKSYKVIVEVKDLTVFSYPELCLDTPYRVEMLNTASPETILFSANPYNKKYHLLTFGPLSIGITQGHGHSLKPTFREKEEDSILIFTRNADKYLDNVETIRKSRSKETLYIQEK